MLLVIFGAGASYDSVPSLPPSRYPRLDVGQNLAFRPPLANELFSDQMVQIGEVKRFPECLPIIPYLQGRSGKSVESELEKLRAEADEDPQRAKQLTAIRYYLQSMLFTCEHSWKDSIMRGISNYKTLLDQIRHCINRKEAVCLVTFNYDTLIEEALYSVGITIQKIEDYVAGTKFSLIKLHGSVNWGRKVEVPVLPSDGREWDIVSALTDAGSMLKLSDDYFLVDGHPIANQPGVVVFPAIAIPVETKKDYECPQAHLDFLSDLLPQVTKVLIVGWRGAESHFLQMLRERLPKDVWFMIVAESPGAAAEIVNRLKPALEHDRFSLAGTGFTGFILNREGEGFLKA